MTTLLPLRYRDMDDEVIITSEGGDFGFFSPSIIPRIIDDELNIQERDRLSAMRIIAPNEDDWRVKSLALQSRRKYSRKNRSISYLMVVPTLRCNLACSYCQVSRAPEDAKGFDWDETHLTALDQFIAEHGADKIKIEFQGGEVSLRPDMISAVEEIANRHCSEIEMVACTNLVDISPEFEKFFGRENFYISTSLDGDIEAMSANRTHSMEAAKSNFKNIQYVIDRYGIDKISFLPTITEQTKNDPEALIDLYASLGASGIFLRPVNHMGFARKRHQEAKDEFGAWKEFFIQALEHIKTLNQTQYFEEVYVADLVRKIFAGDLGAFIDFRSPSAFLRDMAVIDFDGTIYPSDEARMLTRTRHVDLSVGTLFEGLDEEKIATLNSVALNETHPDCIHCAYMPYCGVDPIDDLSRYNRVDLPKIETWFCNKQLFFFDWIFEKIRSKDADWVQIFSRWAHRTAAAPKNLDPFNA
jgi:His-Xaa-Ser system radical SAM maturase HxsB